MTPRQYERLTELFHAAMATAPNERAAFVDQLHGADAELKHELKLLLAAHWTALTQNPPDDIAAGMLLAEQHDWAAGSFTRNTLSHYEIRSMLGKGGMGEVYLADDVRLHRKVALKILPADVASNHDRMRRFEREAQAFAALNHPNIAHVYEIAEAEGTHFIAMEYIDGNTLRQAIHRDKAPLETLLTYLIQVAQGLSKAHAAGIVHRDLKPDNIMIAHDGYPKILDFGLVKLASREFGAETRTREEDDRAPLTLSAAALWPQTDAGLVMGTMGYMSPEQAEGRIAEIDHRSDIFSFGCLLFEAATAIRPLADEPFATHVHPSIPPTLQTVISHCTETEPRNRYQSMDDITVDLKRAREALFGRTDLAKVEPSRLKNRAKPVLIVVTAILAVAYGLYKIAVRERTVISRPNLEISRLTATGKVATASISSDGKRVVYAVDESGSQSIWIREVDTSRNVQLVGPSKATYAYVSFTPDGNFIYFNKSQNDEPTSLYQMPASRGVVHRVIENISSRGAISADGKRIAFIRESASAAENSLIVANIDGSDERILATRPRPDNFNSRAITWTPDGRSITCVTGSRAEKLVEVPLDGNPATRIKTPAWFAVISVEWLPDASGLVVAVLEKIRSSPLQLWYLSFPDGGAHRITYDFNDYLSPSLTGDASTLVAIRRETTSHIWLLPDGDATKGRQLTTGTSRQDGNPSVRWMPDGKIVYDSTASGSRHPWIMNADGSEQRQLTEGPNEDQGVHVSPDGRSILFTSNRSTDNLPIYHIYKVDRDGNNLQQLTWGAGEIAPFFSPDGMWVIYTSTTSGSWKLPVSGGEPVKLSEDGFASDISPDGNFIIHVSKADAFMWRLTITPFTGGPELKSFEVRSDSRPDCHWSRDGRSFAYSVKRGELLSEIGNLWSQSLKGDPPTQLTDFKSDTISGFDWSPDGKWLAVGRGSTMSDVMLIKNFR